MFSLLSGVSFANIERIGAAVPCTKSRDILMSKSCKPCPAVEAIERLQQLVYGTLQNHTETRIINGKRKK